MVWMLHEICQGSTYRGTTYIYQSSASLHNRTRPCNNISCYEANVIFYEDVPPLRWRFISVLASQLSGKSIVSSNFCLGYHQTSRYFIHRWSGDSPYKGPVTWKIFLCHDVFRCLEERQPQYIIRIIHEVCAVLLWRGNIDYKLNLPISFGVTSLALAPSWSQCQWHNLK